MMLPRIDSRVYTNTVLTVIAVLIATLAVREHRINVLSPAFAQTNDATRAGFSRNNIRSAPTDVSNVPQTQDLAVASATSEVATANREIAAAIRELAAAVEGAGSTIRQGMGATPTAAATTGAAARPAAAAERPTIEVAP